MVKKITVLELEKQFAENFKSPIFPLLAEKYFTFREYDKAEKVCQIGISHDKNNYIGKYILAKTHLINNKIYKAEKLLKEIIKSDQNNVNALLTLIEVQISLKRSKKSIVKYILLIGKILPQNKKIQKLYKTFNININKNKKDKIISTKQKINIDSKMATKTMYKLLLKQQKYDLAKQTLLSMIQKQTNVQYAKTELKKLTIKREK